MNDRARRRHRLRPRPLLRARATPPCASTRCSSPGRIADVVFQVAEGGRRTVGQVVVRGLRGTRSRHPAAAPPACGPPGGPPRPGGLPSAAFDLGVFARHVEASDEDPSTITVSVEEGDRPGGRIRSPPRRRGREPGRARRRGAEPLEWDWRCARAPVGRPARGTAGVPCPPSAAWPRDGLRLPDLRTFPRTKAARWSRTRRSTGGQLQLTRRLRRS
jgi:hypothetical protein